LLGECLPSGYVTWILTKQNAEKVFLLLYLLFEDGISALAVNTNCSACRTSSNDVEPPSDRIRVNRNDSCAN